MQDVDAVSVPDAGPALAELDDGALLAMARLDNQEAFAALFARYTYAAHRLARHLGQREEAEDVVSESFAQVLDLVRRGKGPDRAFRAYLFTTIRHESARRAKARRRIVPTDDDRQIDTAVPFGGGGLDEFETSAIRAAYESLPDRWRTVLWHLDVEGRKPHELGPLLDLSANSVSALVYRARSGLRQAYLDQHVNAEDRTAGRSCREIRGKVSAVVRRSASARDQEKVHAHLASCEACMAVYLDLQEVNREVGAIVAPAALAVSTAGLGIGAAVAAGWGAFLAQALLALKGVVGAMVPAAVAAAVTTAAVVGMSTVEVSDPPRTPMAQQVPEPARPAVARAASVAPAHDAIGSDTKTTAEQRGSSSTPVVPRAQHADVAPRAPAPPDPDRVAGHLGAADLPRAIVRRIADLPTLLGSGPTTPVTVAGAVDGLLDGVLIR